MNNLLDLKAWSIGIVPLLLTAFALRYIFGYVRASVPFDASPKTLQSRNSYRMSLAPVSAMFAILLQMLTTFYLGLSFVGDNARLIGFLTIAYGMLGSLLIECLIKFGFKSNCVTVFECMVLERPHIKVYGPIKSIAFVCLLIAVAYVFLWIIDNVKPNPSPNMRSIFPLLLGQFETGFFFLLSCFFSAAIYTGLNAFVAWFWVNRVRNKKGVEK